MPRITKQDGCPSCGRSYEYFGACSACYQSEPLEHSFSTIDEIRPHLRFYSKHYQQEGESFTRYGLYRGLSAGDGMYYPFVKMNVFSSEAQPVDPEWKLGTTPPDDWILKCMFNPDQHRIQRRLPQGHDDDDWVMIHDNGGRPFIVYISPDKTTASIYKIPSIGYLWHEDYVNDDNQMRGYYQELVACLDIERIWIYNEEDKQAFDRGNSLLVLRKDGTYVFVGWEIYSFQTQEDEPIVEYMSEVGNSDVPYPVALSATRAYFMLDRKWVYLDDIKDKMDPYATYYDVEFPKHKAKEFPFEIICKRLD